MAGLVEGYSFTWRIHGRLGRRVQLYQVDPWQVWSKGTVLPEGSMAGLVEGYSFTWRIHGRLGRRVQLYQVDPWQVWSKGTVLPGGSMAGLVEGYSFTWRIHGRLAYRESYQCIPAIRSNFFALSGEQDLG